MYLSIIIPAFNEELRLKNTLQKIYNYLKNKEFGYEIIVVDDGSVDSTSKTASLSLLGQTNKLKILKNNVNKGKGYSVKRGIMEAQGEYILFSDADLSTPIEELDKLLASIQPDADIAIGSRGAKGAQIKVHQPFYREYMGKFFNQLVKIFAVKGIKDTQCGFKLFKSKAAKSIAQKLKIDGFAFDVEMLYLAQKNGLRIKEIPVVWINSPTSKVNPLSDSLKMLFELMNIRKIHSNES